MEKLTSKLGEQFNSSDEIYFFNPTKRSVEIEEILVANKFVTKKYFLPFPYMVFVIRKQFLDNDYLMVLFANENPNKPGIPLYTPPLPNVYQNSRVCLGSETYNVSIELAIKNFWKSRFTDFFNWPHAKTRLRKTFDRNNLNECLIEWGNSKNPLEIQWAGHILTTT